MIKKYLRVYKIFWENGFSYEAQYRGDTWLKLFSNLFWIAMIFITIEVIFSQTSSIVGWNKEQVYLMAVIWIIADELFVTLFLGSLSNIPLLIINGELDLYLVKPISSLFLVSAMKILIRGLYRFLTQLIVFGWLVWQFDFAVSIWHILITVLLVVVAVWVDYSRVLIANIFSFWFARIDNVNDLIGSASSLGRYPLSIWPKTLKIIFLTIVPIAFSSFIPVATLTGRWPWYGVLYAFLFAGLLFWLAVKFWNFAIKRYSSASS